MISIESGNYLCCKLLMHHAHCQFDVRLLLCAVQHTAATCDVAHPRPHADCLCVSACTRTAAFADVDGQLGNSATMEAAASPTACSDACDAQSACLAYWVSANATWQCKLLAGEFRRGGFLRHMFCHALEPACSHMAHNLRRGSNKCCVQHCSVSAQQDLCRLRMGRRCAAMLGMLAVRT